MNRSDSPVIFECGFPSFWIVSSEVVPTAISARRSSAIGTFCAGGAIAGATIDVASVVPGLVTVRLLSLALASSRRSAIIVARSGRGRAARAALSCLN